MKKEQGIEKIPRSFYEKSYSPAGMDFRIHLGSNQHPYPLQKAALTNEITIRRMMITNVD